MALPTRRVPRAPLTRPEDIARDLRQVVSIAAAANVEGLQIRLRSPAPVGTPRATGFASANWLISLYRPGPEVFTPGSISERAAGVPTARRLSDGTRVNLANYDSRRGSVFLSNAVEYIVPLNMGSSKQTPRNFVQTQLQRTATDTGTRRKIAQQAGPGVSA